jgi:hypothetical protein
MTAAANTSQICRVMHDSSPVEPAFERAPFFGASLGSRYACMCGAFAGEVLIRALKVKRGQDDFGGSRCK